jgi:uncharacterized protein YjdB
MMNRIRGLAALVSIAGLVGLNSCRAADGTAPDCDAIQAALVSRVEVAPGSAAVTTGDSLQLQARAFSCAGALPDVTDFQWRASNDDVAIVSPSGLVKAISSGNATIYASTGDKEGMAQVLAQPPGVAEVRVEPATVTLGEQQSSGLTARAFDSQGRELIGRTVTWASAVASVVTVDGQGSITGIAAGGPVAVTATIEGRSAASQVTVVSLAVDKVEVTPSTPTVGVGGTVQLTARLTDAFNNELTGRVVSWSSSDPLVASVDQSTGLVTGLVPGTATVTATSEGKSGSALVTVTVAPQGSGGNTHPSQ